MFRVGRSDRPDAVRMEGTGAKRYLSGNGFAERMAPPGGPKLLWETMDAGKGYSSPVIVGDRLYLTGMNEDETQEILFRL